MSTTRRVKFEMHAPSNTHFGPDAFRTSVGRTMPVTFGGTEDVRATIVDVKISDDGIIATFTAELPPLVFDFLGMS